MAGSSGSSQGGRQASLRLLTVPAGMLRRWGGSATALALAKFEAASRRGRRRAPRGPVGLLGRSLLIAAVAHRRCQRAARSRGSP